MKKLLLILSLCLIPLTAGATFGQGWVYTVPGTNFYNSSTSPTFNYITATSTTATSTFGNGLNITRGCFALNGTCISAGTGVTSVSGTWPIISSGGNTPTISWGGLATTSNLSASGLIYAVNGTNGVASVSTSTLSATSPLTGSFTQVGTGGSLGCQTASGAQAGCLSSTDWTTFNNKQAALSGGSPNALTFWSNASTLGSTSSPAIGYITATTTTATSTFYGGVSFASTTATTTHADGINLTGGCFAVNGTCITGGSGSGTVNSGTAGQSAYYASNGTAVSGTSTFQLLSTGAYFYPLNNSSISSFSITQSSVGGGEVLNFSGPILANSGLNVDYKANHDLLISNTETGTTTIEQGSGNKQLQMRGTTSFFNGNVGFGTTSPYRALSVYGSSDLGNNAIAGYFTATTSTASLLPYASTTMITATTASTTNLTISGLATSTGSVLAVSPTGSVIATSTPFDKAANIASTTLDNSGKSFSTASTTFNLWNPSTAVQALALYCKTTNGTVTAEMGNGSASTTAICSTSGVTVSSSITWAARSDIKFVLKDTSASGASRVTLTSTFRNQ